MSIETVDILNIERGIGVSGVVAMQTNRLTQWLEEVGVSDSSPAPAARSLAGFAVCPAMLVQVPWQVQIYQAAYEQARAAVEAQSARPAFKLCWN
jgi:hypothetical protein